MLLLLAHAAPAADRYALVWEDASLHLTPDLAGPTVQLAEPFHRPGEPGRLRAVRYSSETERFVQVITLDTDEGSHCHPALTTPGLHLELYVEKSDLALVNLLPVHVGDGNAVIWLQPGVGVATADLGYALQVGSVKANVRLDGSTLGTSYASVAPFAPDRGTFSSRSVDEIQDAGGAFWARIQGEAIPVRLDGERVSHRNRCVAVSGPTSGIAVHQPMTVAAAVVGATMADPVSVVRPGATLTWMEGSFAGTALRALPLEAPLVKDESGLGRTCFRTGLGIPACAAETEVGPPPVLDRATYRPVDQIRTKRSTRPRPPSGHGLAPGHYTCTLSVFLDEEGVLRHVELVSCPAVLWPAAEAAIHKWTFYPETIHGEHTRTRGLVTLAFDL